jgi:putative Mg2+ transporter-C (MgtC) family protein
MGNSSWLFGSWWDHVPHPWASMLFAMTAVICGMIVGGERQRREKPAGLRTLILVCLGSAVFTMLSFAFTSTTGDSGRVAAQIVTGIGFLGAGVVLHGRRVVSGVTTAAIIWVSAAIGMTVGAGYVLAGLGLSVLVHWVMVVIGLYETRWHPDLRNVSVAIEFAPNGGLTRIRLERILVDYYLVGEAAHWSEVSANRSRLTLKMRLPQIHLYELLADLADVPDVVSFEREQRKPVQDS